MSDDEKRLQWRREGVTATDVADAAAGTYGGMYGVVARKLGRVTVEQNEQMARGHRWQPVIADAVHVLTGLYVVGEETWCQCTGDDRWRATVDGFLSLPGRVQPGRPRGRARSRRRSASACHRTASAGCPRCNGKCW